MKRYLEHMHSKEPHERRVHAMHMAGTLTAVIFVAWLATLGGRLASHNASQLSEDGSENQVANILNGVAMPENQLFVATSSDY